MDPQIPPSGTPQPIRPQVVPEPQTGPLRVVIEEPRRFGKFGRRLFWTVLVISILFNLSLTGRLAEYVQPDSHVQEKYHSLSKIAAEKVAIISVEGTIMKGEGFVKDQIDAALHDPHVKAVVLRVDSPGGTVTGSDYIYHHLQKLVDAKKPLVVSMGSLAASGGYYISMAAGPNQKTIFAEPTCWTGSIGVIIPHYDISELLTKWHIQDDSVASHPLKQMGSPTAILPEKYREEEKEIFKQLVDTTFSRFKEIVLASRPDLKADPQSQDVVFTGRVFTAGEAKERHLVDELGFIEDAINRAIELAVLDPNHVRVVKYQKPMGLLDQLLLGSKSREARLDLTAILDLSAPRAYYLHTLLPAVARNEH